MRGTASSIKSVDASPESVSSTVITGSYQIDAMTVDDETCFQRSQPSGLFERTFQLVRRLYIRNPAAGSASDVVMMTSTEFVGQLEIARVVCSW